MTSSIETSYDGHNVVFLVGCARSGTTWLQRLLASHPKIRTGQESFLFSSYIGPQLRNWSNEIRTLSSGRGGAGMRAYLREDEFLSILREEMFRFMKPMIGDLPDGYLFLEKTPNHALWMPEIIALLPKARFINMLRDGRDVVASLLAASRTWANWAPDNALGASRRWVRNVEAAEKAAKKLSPEQFYEVRYEQLLNSPKLVLQNVSRFLGINWNENEIVDAIKKNDAKVALKTATPIPIRGEFSVISGSEVKQPPGFIRRARAGSWKQDLSPVEKMLTWIGASRTMAKVGYPWILPWL
jgi:hypothetical protein